MKILAGALNSQLELQCYKILFICGNYFCILSQTGRQFNSAGRSYEPSPSSIS
jgi:hypothetical protein